jgi:hypothetical protein
MQQENGGCVKSVFSFGLIAIINELLDQGI